MPDWNGNLAFVDATGRHPALFDFAKAGSYVRVRVYGQKFKGAFSSSWFTNLKFDEATGKSLSSSWPGKIVNVSEDMLAGLDLETGQPQKYTLAEAAKILGTQTPAAGKYRAVIEYVGGSAKIVSVDAVP